MLKNNLFKKYLNKVFVETGSYMGDGVQFAIEAGFEKIYSIELSDKYFDICTKRFANNKNVIIVKGDSCEILLDVIKDIDVPITFWLDGHHSCGDTALGKYWTPLMQELDQIKKHFIKNHTILIDDMQCWLNFNPIHGFYKPDILNKLNDINDKYSFEYEDTVIPKDVLVAKIINK
jgi:hypothetical protein